MTVGWIIFALAAVPFISFATYTEVQERRSRRDILLHGVSALGTIVERKGNSGRRASWDITIDFQAKDHPEQTRIVMRIFVRSQMSSWGDWDSFLGLPEWLDDFQVGQSVPLHYPKQWPGLAIIDARPNALRVN
jgi:hypothetical protein